MILAPVKRQQHPRSLGRRLFPKPNMTLVAPADACNGRPLRGASGATWEIPSLNWASAVTVCGYLNCVVDRGSTSL